MRMELQLADSQSYFGKILPRADMYITNKYYNNKMKRLIARLFSFYICLVVATSIFAQTKNRNAEKDRFISNLMEKMTIEEKIAQMNLITPTAGTGPFKTKRAFEKLKEGSAGNVLSIRGTAESIREKVAYTQQTRLKIPILLALDIIHGYKTVFPIPLGLSCSWDTILIKKTARIAAIEATAMGYHSTYSPMVDLTRDPRWGRVMEGSGEDPYLGSLIARAMVKGYQGEKLNDPTSLLACMKHLGLYGAAEAGRDYNTTDMSKLTMYQYYLPPYRAAIEAGVGSAMTSFNDIDGIPATANKWLLTDLLRGQWGFKGFVVTDYNAIQELIPHGVAADYEEAAKKSLDAGTDMDMTSEGYITYLSKLLREGKVDISQIDKACRRILEAKYDLGLFDDPYKGYEPGRAEKVILCQEHKEMAKLAALKAVVLLKNEAQTLPINKNNKIALIGPFANSKNEMLSMWSPDGVPDSVVTVLEGIQKRVKEVNYAEGTFMADDPTLTSFATFDREEQNRKIEEAVALANKSDVIVAMLGESRNLSGEAKSMTKLSLPNCQRELLKALKATGKPLVLVLTNGRPLTLTEDMQYADAVIEAWRLGTMAGEAISDVLLGNYNPSGKLTMTFPRSVGQIPIYYNHKNTGRPFIDGDRGVFKSRYLDEMNAPLFPFGYGLSYTTFDYGDIVLSDTLLAGEKKRLTVSVAITNSGKYAGEETVQLYLNDPVASVARPVKELKMFQKIYLNPGETRKIVFTLTPEDLKFYNSNLNWNWEAGVFNVYVGTSSEDVKNAHFVWNK